MSMKKINAYASERHYYEKLLPIWSLLPDRLKGEFTVHSRLDGAHAARTAPPNQDGILLVASHTDSLHAKEKYIYVEHGAGQTYNPSSWYSNAHRPNMLAAIVPGPYCAETTQAANPGVPIIVMGAPQLAHIERQNPQSLAFAWHWRCGIEIESDTAFDQYAEVMFEASRKWKTIGHGHPRIIGELSMIYSQNGIETVYNSHDVLAHAGLLVADNTSLIYEAAALDIPVLLVNRSDWRKDKHWGLRFWDVLPGPMVDSPEELIPEIERQLAGDSDNFREQRKKVTEMVYGTDPFGRLQEAVRLLAETCENYARFN